VPVENFKIQKLTPSIGAELSGFNLSEKISIDLLEEIYCALIDHQVIFLRNQQITPAIHSVFSKSFVKT